MPCGRGDSAAGCRPPGCAGARSRGSGIAGTFLALPSHSAGTKPCAALEVPARCVSSQLLRAEAGFPPAGALGLSEDVAVCAPSQRSPSFPPASCPAGCGETLLSSRAVSTCLEGSANPAGHPPDGYPPDGQRPVIMIIAHPSPRSLVRRWGRSASLPIPGARLPVPSEAEPKHLLSKRGLVRELLVTQKRKPRHGLPIFSCQ